MNAKIIYLTKNEINRGLSFTGIMSADRRAIIAHFPDGEYFLNIAPVISRYSDQAVKEMRLWIEDNLDVIEATR